ncbi:uncharacterized protein MELLADRAFT_60156 [Melampsora larici-populina 98AG31]|uniref:Uncharacterized protein n=1 Tax=Melampsora larici-populina (strain 98AG31 / pathotype 3-4-7) TaxID=747676 RepID=F4RAA8_MELLP|nr:uncharacterized protein MELLADRAFT_60156 [Melampsora larici-populina 98AG31]EGG10813.1 hypothetical protein MELLADRAFT_60156 [Melampsora larici-populina 98AG31]
MKEIIQELNNLNDLGAHSIQSSTEFNPTSNEISDNPAEISSLDASYTFDPKHSTSNNKKTSSSIPNLNTSNRNSKLDSGEVTNPSSSSDTSKTQDCDTLNSNNQKTTSDNEKNQKTSQQNQAAIPNLNISQGNSNNNIGTTEHQSKHSSEQTNDPSKIPDSSDTKEEASDSLDTPKPEDCDQDNQSSKTTTTTNPKPKSPTSQNSYQSDSMGSNQAFHQSGNEINPTHQIQSQKEKTGGDYV